MTATVLMFAQRGKAAQRQLSDAAQKAPAAPPRPPAPTPPPSTAPDLSRFFASVVRTHIEPHPMGRIVKPILNMADLFGWLLQRVLSAYLLVVMTLAAPMALVAGRSMVAAYCALMGMLFASLVVEDIRRWRRGRLHDSVTVAGNRGGRSPVDASAAGAGDPRPMTTAR
jgi:hypothetical protein